MDRFRSLRRADKSRELDRGQWADLDKISFSQKLSGSGEALSEPIYFGRAFDSPPQFSYSLVGSVEESGGVEEVKTFEYPPPDAHGHEVRETGTNVLHGSFSRGLSYGGTGAQIYWPGQTMASALWYTGTPRKNLVNTRSHTTRASKSFWPAHHNEQVNMKIPAWYVGSYLFLHAYSSDNITFSMSTYYPGWTLLGSTTNGNGRASVWYKQVTEEDLNYDRAGHLNVTGTGYVAWHLVPVNSFYDFPPETIHFAQSASNGMPALTVPNGRYLYLTFLGSNKLLATNQTTSGYLGNSQGYDIGSFKAINRYVTSYSYATWRNLLVTNGFTTSAGWTPVDTSGQLPVCSLIALKAAPHKPIGSYAGEYYRGYGHSLQSGGLSPDASFEMSGRYTDYIPVVRDDLINRGPSGPYQPYGYERKVEEYYNGRWYLFYGNYWVQGTDYEDSPTRVPDPSSTQWDYSDNNARSLLYTDLDYAVAGPIRNAEGTGDGALGVFVFDSWTQLPLRGAGSILYDIPSSYSMGNISGSTYTTIFKTNGFVGLAHPTSNSCDNSTYGGKQGFYVETIDPHVGTYHLEAPYNSTYNRFGSMGGLMFVGGRTTYAAPPCIEPRLTGVNILKDPGFENHLAVTGGGPGGDEIPGTPTVPANYDILLAWTDASEATDDSGWHGDTNSLSPSESRWWIETANPDTGTYHARTTREKDGGYLSAYGFTMCVEQLGEGISALVQPGDVINWSVRNMVSSTTGGPQTILVLELWDESAGTQQFYSDTVTPSTSYQTFSMNLVVPALISGVVPYYLIARVGTVWNSAPTTTAWDVDNAVLGVT